MAAADDCTSCAADRAYQERHGIEHRDPVVVLDFGHDGLGHRVSNILVRRREHHGGGYTSYEEVAAASARGELAGLRNMGARGVERVEAVLAERRLRASPCEVDVVEETWTQPTRLACTCGWEVSGAWGVPLAPLIEEYVDHRLTTILR